MRERSGWRTASAAIVLASILALGAALPARAGHLDGPCALHRWTNETIRHLSKRHIACAVRTFGPVPGGSPRAICIAKRESDLVPDASSLTGRYLGLYQHATKYWEKRYAIWTRTRWALPDRAISGRTNSIVTIRMVHAAHGWRAAGWPVVDC